MNNNSTSSGLGITSVLTIIFIVLKLIGVIDWSWWLVFSPTLINIVFSVISFIVALIFITLEEDEWEISSKKGKQDKWKF